MSRNEHVQRILETERFDAVVFSFFEYNTEFYDPDPAYTRNLLAGADSLFRLIVANGARGYVNVGYATADNPGDTTRIASGMRAVAARLASVAEQMGTAPPVTVPGGPFFGHMAGEIGRDRWFADPLHASELGQYAMARFFFSHIAGRDPTTFAHPSRIAPSDARRIDAAILRFLRLGSEAPPDRLVRR